MASTIHENIGLLSRFIDAHSNSSDAGDARIIDSGVPVWVLVMYTQALSGDLKQVARDYGLPIEAVMAALVYYVENKAAVDEQILRAGAELV